MVDSANGISGELSPAQFTFVPVELTVSVLRHPRTEWVGMSARTTIDGDGIGHTRAELFDEAGYLGTALQTLFVSPATRR
jgi:acyl-CoA thioesterase